MIYKVTSKIDLPWQLERRTTEIKLHSGSSCLSATCPPSLPKTRKSCVRTHRHKLGRGMKKVAAPGPVLGKGGGCPVPSVFEIRAKLCWHALQIHSLVQSDSTQTSRHTKAVWGQCQHVFFQILPAFAQTARWVMNRLPLLVAVLGTYPQIPFFT